jgi:UDP-2-acetamido-3-amino-2,3-dideoxy-glucuronate N-acetyltransferase
MVSKKFGATIFHTGKEIWDYYGVKMYPMSMVMEGAEIGEGTRIQSFTVIEAGAVIGKNCTIRAHNTVIGAVTMEDNVFMGSGTQFIDRRYPRNNHPEDPTERTYIERDVVLGVNSTIFPVWIGQGAIIGAASLVLKDVPPYEKVKGTWDR